MSDTSGDAVAGEGLDGIEAISLEQARVLGALLEKEQLTPDTYPLTLNALVTACNQSSSRDPVVAYDEATVTQALDALMQRRWVQQVVGAGSRVTKYRQMLVAQWSLSTAEAAVLCLLLLRGPQTPGELKSRAGRLHDFQALADVDSVLERLSEVRYPPRVLRQERQAGMKESRFMHTLCGTPSLEAAPAVLSTAERLNRLEEEVAQLREELRTFRAAFG